jgi:4-hydroxy-tetrahydrodipicolinate reductase
MIKKVALIGASGRMGRELLLALRDFPQFQLAAALVSSRSSSIGIACGTEAVTFEAYAAERLDSVDCVIDFSSPTQTGLIALECSKRGLPLLIGTTGIDELCRETIAHAAQSIPILLAPNTSIGVAALSELASLAQKILGPSFDVELSEIHHREKKDAPSGTAKALATRLSSEAQLVQTFNREGKRESGELGITSLRGGEVFGEHTVYFFGNGERIEITHRAESRSIFARGAFALMLALIDRPVGVCQVADLLV